MKKFQPFIVGLTGSIGMGKSTTAGMFAELGVAIWDADAAVARIYSKKGAGVEAIQDIYPDAIVNEQVSKNALRSWISRDPEALAKIENVIHPLVALDRTHFLASSDHEIVVLDIPLLFETGQADDVDMVCVVSAAPEVQRRRVMDRPGMTEETFRMILSKQMDDGAKRERADHVIPTDTMETARSAVQKIVENIRKNLANA